MHFFKIILVGKGGFEPPACWFKVSYSTAELLPNMAKVWGFEPQSQGFGDLHLTVRTHPHGGNAWNWTKSSGLWDPSQDHLHYQLCFQLHTHGLFPIRILYVGDPVTDRDLSSRSYPCVHVKTELICFQSIIGFPRTKAKLSNSVADWYDLFVPICIV